MQLLVTLLANLHLLLLALWLFQDSLRISNWIHPLQVVALGSPVLKVPLESRSA